MHRYGPAPSGDFWFLLVASKGTRRRQGIWGKVVNFDCGTDEFHHPRNGLPVVPRVYAEQPGTPGSGVRG